MTKPRAPRSVRESLRDALNSAKMGDDAASFGWPTDTLTHNGTTHTVDRFVKDRTKLYRETWIIPRLEAVLAWAEGKEPEQ